MNRRFNVVLLCLAIIGLVVLAMVKFTSLGTSDRYIPPNIGPSANRDATGTTKATPFPGSYYFKNFTENLFDKITSSLEDMKLRLRVYETSAKWHSHITGFKRGVFKCTGYTTALSNPHVLMDDVLINCQKQFKLLIFVSSYAPHIERRNRIRSMWGNRTMWNTQLPWKVVFVLGVKEEEQNDLEEVKKESAKHKDILLEDVGESFHRLSYKVMIGLQWAHTSLKFDFLLKCDDDVFVHVDHMMNQLTTELKDGHYIGNVMDGQPVERKGRYKLTMEEHKEDVFKPYCSGGGFILSHHAIGKIIPLFSWDSPLVIDDAYFGSLIFKAGLKPLHSDKGFLMWNDWCEYTDKLLVTHPAKKLSCMEFLQKRALIENSKYVNDTLKNMRYGNKPPETPTPVLKTVKTDKPKR